MAYNNLPYVEARKHVENIQRHSLGTSPASARFSSKGMNSARSYADVASSGSTIQQISNSNPNNNNNSVTTSKSITLVNKPVQSEDCIPLGLNIYFKPMIKYITSLTISQKREEFLVKLMRLIETNNKVVN